MSREPLFLLYDVARLVRTRADQRARLMGMTRAQWVILAWLELRPGLSQNELAGLVEVEPITIGRLIDRLEQRAMVERRNDPRDRRVRRLHLRPAAQEALAAIHAYRAELNERFRALAGAPAMAQLAETLMALKGGLAEDVHQPSDTEGHATEGLATEGTAA